MAIAINVRGLYGKPGAIVKAALRSKNAAEVHFPRELHEAVQQEGMVQGQVRRPFVQVWSIIENAGFGDRIPVARYEGAARVGLAADRIGDERGHSHKAVGGARGSGERCSEVGLQVAYKIGIQSVVGFMGPSVV